MKKLIAKLLGLQTPMERSPLRTTSVEDCAADLIASMEAFTRDITADGEEPHTAAFHTYSRFQDGALYIFEEATPEENKWMETHAKEIEAAIFAKMTPEEQARFRS
jgi:hypothetical protein